MMRVRRLLPVMLALLLAAAPAFAGGRYSLPHAGVILEAEDSWVTLTPETLRGEDPFLLSLGADIAAMQADYAATGTCLEVFLPDGAQVRLSIASLPDGITAAEFGLMTQPEADALIAIYQRAPFESAAFISDPPGALTCEWLLDAGGTPLPCAYLVTVRQGALYTLSAMGAGLDAATLHAANREVYRALTFVGTRAEGTAAETAQALPAAIPADGVVTPLSFRDFTGVTETDLTTIYIQTAPGAEVTLKTASDTLRGRADDDGRHQFTVSTRRDSVYTYTAVVKAQDLKESELPISIERRLTGEALAEAYRRDAQLLSKIGYDRVVENPAEYQGRTAQVRGQVAAVSEANGYPCLLVLSVNQGRGNWTHPVWVVLAEPFEAKVGDTVSAYGELRGDTLPTDGGDAPVLVGRYFSK